MSPNEHKLERINFYQYFHKPCLIIWEHEIKSDINNVKYKITNFINQLFNN